MSPETNWFATCRDSNLEVVGPILGYFLRTKAQHFCQNLSPNWNLLSNLDNVENILSICEKAVIPFVVELSVAERTVKQLEKFVHISSDDLHAIKVHRPPNDNRSRNMAMYEIRREYHNWAWDCLKSGDVVPPTETSTAPTLLCSDAANKSPPISLIESKDIRFSATRSGRIVKKRKFFDEQ